MKRRILTGAVAFVALAAVAVWLRPTDGADAAPGDVDLEITAVGTYDNGPDPHTGTFEITVTNDPNGGLVESDATDVVVDVDLVTAGGNIAGVVDSAPAGTTYDPGSFEWSIPLLAPGDSLALLLDLTMEPALDGVATVSPQVTTLGVGETDIDSSPTDGGIVGDEDDEAVYRIQNVVEPAFTGLVWNDIDSNGTSEPTEPGVADTFVVVEQGAEVLYAGRTLADGTYTYDHLPNGSTDITFIQPDGYDFTLQSSDPDGSDPDQITGEVTAFAVTSLNRDTIDAGLTADADLLVEKSASLTSGIPGTTTTYTVRVVNAGPGATDGVELVDQLPSAAVLDELTITESQGTATYDDPSDMVTWTVGQLLAGEDAEVTYEVEYNLEGTFVNEAQVTASEANDPDSVPDPLFGPCSGQPTDDDCASATVDIGADPTPSTDTVLTPQGTPVTFNVLDNDGIFGRNDGEALPPGWSWDRLDASLQGSVSCNINGDCTYEPAAGYAGLDGFQYELTTPTASTTIVDVVLESLFVNDTPVALDDQATTGLDTDAVIDVLANDSDTNTPPDTIEIVGTGSVSPPTAGTFTCPTPTGDCTFDPEPTFTGVATVEYTIQDSGASDPRVEDPGVPGGYLADDPLSDTATVTVVVDPEPLPLGGFTGGTGGVTQADAGTWIELTTVTVTTQCLAGRPQVTVAWTAVDRADSYLVQRRVGGSAWVVIDRVDEPTLQLVDELVGEGTGYLYTVTPYVARWAGTPFASSATTPALTSPSGCT
jgi:uncharacterized repeat protein (TIGR01451 family)